MTESEAIAIARSFVEEHQIEVAEITAVRRIPASLLGPSHQGGDRWAVLFRIPTPEGTVRCPESEIVRIDDLTGEVTLYRGP